MRSGKWQITEGIELLNQERNKPLGEKETYKYLEIFEVGTIKQVQMKDKTKKCTSDERASFSKSNSAAGILSKW